MSETKKPKTNASEQKRKQEIIDYNLREIESLDFEAIETPQLDEFRTYRPESEAKFAEMQKRKLAEYKAARANGQEAKLPVLTKKAYREIHDGQRELQDDDVHFSRIEHNQADVDEIREIQRQEDIKNGYEGTYDTAKAVEKLFVTYLNNSQFFDLNNETLKTRLASDYDDLKNGVDIYSIIEGEPDDEGYAPSLIIAFDITTAKVSDKLTKKLTKRKHYGPSEAQAGGTQITYYAKPGEDEPKDQQRENPKTHVLLYTLSLSDKAFQDVLSKTVISEDGLEQNGIDACPDLKLKFLLQIQAQNYYYLATIEREIEEIEEEGDDYCPVADYRYVEDKETFDYIKELNGRYDSAVRWRDKILKMISIVEDSIQRSQKEMFTSNIPEAEKAIREILDKPEGPLTLKEIREGIQKYLAEAKKELLDSDGSYKEFAKIADRETTAEEQKKHEVQMRRRAKLLGEATQNTPEE